MNSSKVRAVQGRQANDFVLTPIIQPANAARAEKHGRKKKGARTTEVVYGPKQKWVLDEEIDRSTRTDCEGT